MINKDILAINLKYYRYVSKLSQEKFAEKLETSLIYINQLENAKRNTSLNMLDKLADKISKLLKIKITSYDLIFFDKTKIITSNRIDTKK